MKNRLLYFFSISMLIFLNLHLLAIDKKVETLQYLYDEPENEIIKEGTAISLDAEYQMVLKSSMKDVCTNEIMINRAYLEVSFCQEIYSQGITDYEANLNLTFQLFNGSIFKDSIYNVNFQIGRWDGINEVSNHKKLIEIPIHYDIDNITINVRGYNSVGILSPILKIKYIEDIKIAPTYTGQFETNNIIAWSPIGEVSLNSSGYSQQYGNQVIFRWTRVGDCADHPVPLHQIQVLRLYNVECEGDAIYGCGISFERLCWSNSSTFDIDWSNALMFECSNKPNIDELGLEPFYADTITLTQGTGYYLWRVRPIGDMYGEPLSDSRNFGDWSKVIFRDISSEHFYQLLCGEDGKGGLICSDDMGCGMELIDTLKYLSSSVHFNPDDVLVNGIFFYNQFDEELNWSYSRSFMEDGYGTDMLEQMTYADDLLKSRQVQSYMPADKKKLVTENVPDYAGRTALTTIPVPVDNYQQDEGTIGHIPKIIKSSNGSSIFSAKDYDAGSYYDQAGNNAFTNSTFYNPKPIYDETGEYWDYYNGETYENRVADAKGYPYIRQKYFSDGTGRVKETSMIGETHKIKNEDHGYIDNTGKTIQHYYQSVTEEEILALFGNETPDPKDCRKYIDIDQNGVVNISYKTKDGRILATCLENESANSLNLDTLNENSSKQYKKGITIPISPVGWKDGVLECTKTFVLSQEKNVYLNLNIHEVNAAIEACGDEFCVACDYIFNFKLIANENGAICDDYTEQVSGSILECPSETEPRVLFSNKKYHLPAGSYSLVCRMTTNEEYINQLVAQKRTTYVENYSELFSEVYSTIADMELYEFDNDKVDMGGFYSLLDDYVNNTKTLNGYTVTTKVDSNAEVFEYVFVDDFGCSKLTIPVLKCPECNLYDKEGNITFENDLNNIWIKKREEIETVIFQSKKLSKDKKFDTTTYHKLKTLFSDTLDIKQILYFNGIPFETYFNINFDTGLEEITAGDLNQRIQNIVSSYPGSEKEVCECLNLLLNQFEQAFEYVYGENDTLKLYPIAVIFDKQKAFSLLESLNRCFPPNYNDSTHSQKKFITNPELVYFGNNAPPEPNCVCDVTSSTGEDFKWGESWMSSIPKTSDNDWEESYGVRPWETFYHCINNLAMDIDDDNFELSDDAKKLLEDKYGEGFFDEANLDNNSIIEMYKVLQEDCEAICDSSLPSVQQLVLNYLNENHNTVQGQYFWYAYDTQDMEYKKTWFDSEEDANSEEYLGYAYGYYGPYRISKYNFDCICDAVYNHCYTKCEVYELINNYEDFIDTAKICDKYIMPEEMSKNIRDVMGKQLTIRYIECNIEQYTPSQFLYSYYNPCAEPAEPVFVYGKMARVVAKMNAYLKSDFQNKLDSLWDIHIVPLVGNDYNFPYDLTQPYGQVINYNGDVKKTLEWKITELLDSLYVGWEYELPCVAQDTNSKYYFVLDELNWEIKKAEDLLHPGPPNLMESSIWKSIFFIIPESIQDSCDYRTDYSFEMNLDYYTFSELTLKRKLTDTYSGIVELCSFSSPCDCKVCVEYIDPEDKFEDIDFTVPAIYPEDCAAGNAETIRALVDYHIQERADFAASQIKCMYRGGCTGLGYYGDFQDSVKYYHYTLFYYDRQGNLIKTIPPKGVNINETYTRNTPTTHSMATKYYYDALGQLIEKQIPDWDFPQKMQYDVTGQLTYLQTPNQCEYNTSQDDSLKVTYFEYDDLKRLVETGEAVISKTDYPNATWAGLNPNLPLGTTVAKYSYKIFTEYSTALDPTLLPNLHSDFEQTHIRNRISYTYRDNDGDLSSISDRVYTVYSYDLHGNVTSQLQFVPDLWDDVTGTAFEQTHDKYRSGRVDYDFDLLSGKVKKVSFNADRFNEFYQRYAYDAELRLRKVETSREGEHFYEDSRYEYFPHGPLKRIEYGGTDRLQGVDYTYTSNGWLKAINSSEGPGMEPGLDAWDGEHRDFCNDGFGMTLNYFTGDYRCQPVTDPDKYSYFDTEFSGSYRCLSDRPLYDGNISSWELQYTPIIYDKTDFHEETGIHIDGYKFEYDVLGRLLKNNAFKRGGYQSVFSPIGSLNWPFSHYKYDENGNFTDLVRTYQNNQSPPVQLTMDNMYYSNRIGTNRLDNIFEQAILTQDVENDFEYDHSYSYDASGNMILDSIPNDIVIHYTWTGDGKIKSIKKTQPSPPYLLNKIVFLYDASGNRFSKKVISTEGLYCNDKVADKIEYYFRDASGNPLAITTIDSYGRTDEYGSLCGGMSEYLVDSLQFSTEWNIYGNAQEGNFATAYSYPTQIDSLVVRLQCNNPCSEIDIVAESDSLTSADFSNIKGCKNYVLKDHLGNIRLKYRDARRHQWLDVVGVYHYYPYGKLIENRTWEATESRFGFQGQERDDEVAGAGNYIHYKARDYSALTSRMDRIDPLSDKFPSQSPYITSGNNPIGMIDFEGKAASPGLYRSSLYLGFKWGMGEQAALDYLQTDYEIQKAAAEMVLEDYKIVFTGTDFDGNKRNRYIAGGFVLLDLTGVKVFSSINYVRKISKVGRSVSKVVNVSDALDGATDVWKLSWIKRGKIIDKALGNNLGVTFSGIDCFDEARKTVTSIKSIDLGAATYQDMSKLKSKLKGYVNELKRYNGSRLGYKKIKSTDYDTKILEIAIPPQASDDQLKIIDDIIDYGKSQNVNVKITEVK